MSHFAEMCLTPSQLINFNDTSYKSNVWKLKSNYAFYSRRRYINRCSFYVMMLFVMISKRLNYFSFDFAMHVLVVDFMSQREKRKEKKRLSLWRFEFSNDTNDRKCESFSGGSNFGGLNRLFHSFWGACMNSWVKALEMYYNATMLLRIQGSA